MGGVADLEDEEEIEGRRVDGRRTLRGAREDLFTVCPTGIPAPSRLLG